MNEQTDEAPAGPAPDSLLRRWFLGIGRTALVLVSVFVLAGTGYGWAAVRHLDRGVTRTNVIDPAAAGPTRSGGPITEPLDTPLNVLLVGMDSRTDPQGDPLPANELDMLHAGPDNGEIDTDTMILVHIPAGGKRAVAISFPRDSYVQLAGEFGKHRLNSAFAYAHNAEASRLRAQGQTDPAAIERQADEAGRKNLIDTIQDLLGGTVTINRYAEVNLGGFYNLANAVGGVQVCLKQATHDDYTDASFPAGVQTLTGVQALNFVRQRHGLPRGDLDRIVRQQVFLGSLANQILSAGTLTDPAELDRLINAVQQSVTLSAGWDITTFAAQMAGLSSGNVQFTTIPTGPNITNAEGDVTQINPTQVRDAVNALISAADQGTAITTPPTSSTSASDTPTTSPDGSPSSVPVTSGRPGGPTAPSGNPSSDPAVPATITADGLPCIN